MKLFIWRIIFLMCSNFSYANYIMNDHYKKIQQMNVKIQFKLCLKAIQSKRPIQYFNEAYHADPEIIFIVNSKPEDYIARCGIRLTWSHMIGVEYPDIDGFLVFFQVGYKENYNIQRLRRENYTYGDMLIHNNVSDTYRNLGRKNIESLKFIWRNYPNVKLVVKTDSDIFWNMPKFMQHLAKIKNSNITYEGVIIKNGNVLRDPLIKNYEPYDHFSNKTYPPYCTGGGYLIRYNIIPCLLNVSSNFRPLNNEDTDMAVNLRRCGIYPSTFESYCEDAVLNPNFNLALKRIQLFQNCFLIHGIEGYNQIGFKRKFYK